MYHLETAHSSFCSMRMAPTRRMMAAALGIDGEPSPFEARRKSPETDDFGAALALLDPDDHALASLPSGLTRGMSESLSETTTEAPRPAPQAQPAGEADRGDADADQLPGAAQLALGVAGRRQPHLRDRLLVAQHGARIGAMGDHHAAAIELDIGQDSLVTKDRITAMEGPRARRSMGGHGPAPSPVRPPLAPIPLCASPAVSLM